MRAQIDLRRAKTVAIKQCVSLRPRLRGRSACRRRLRYQCWAFGAHASLVRRKCAEITATLSTMHSDVLTAAAAPAAASPADRALSAADDALDFLAKLRARVDALEDEAEP